MDDFVSISLLSLAMLVGCYVAGIIPLAVNFSEERLKLVTVLGAGLLCGTALAVIVPEGVHALYEDVLEGKHHQASETQNVIASDKAAPAPAAHDHELGHKHTELHAYIGVSLVLGFVFMLLVDQIGSSHVHTTEDSEAARPSNSKITTTLGLVVHAAADGVALGAAASTSQTSVQLIVFVAIMLHKAPAAFGLVSFLMHAGLERNRIRRHLLVFALAAPVMSMVTYLGLSKSSKEALSEVNATGVAMLFSAGTFLYVATVHVLPEAGLVFCAVRPLQDNHFSSPGDEETAVSVLSPSKKLPWCQPQLVHALECHLLLSEWITHTRSWSDHGQQ
ncbi:zinc transporter ZIP9 isoform X2 [Echinops telfairi]|uniref:Zinc transporter ZIP9 n=1 Tax=Echinops telfairi TaxID=9371 RepID=A0ABM0IFA4_ECHTE|nr:zinc transporter ZIP9 isoform X2 [Echinops telfairi]